MRRPPSMRRVRKHPAAAMRSAKRSDPAIRAMMRSLTFLSQALMRASTFLGRHTPTPVSLIAPRQWLQVRKTAVQVCSLSGRYFGWGVVARSMLSKMIVSTEMGKAPQSASGSDGRSRVSWAKITIACRLGGVSLTNMMGFIKSQMGCTTLSTTGSENQENLLVKISRI